MIAYNLDIKNSMEYRTLKFDKESTLNTLEINRINTNMPTHFRSQFKTRLSADYLYKFVEENDIAYITFDIHMRMYLVDKTGKKQFVKSLVNDKFEVHDTTKYGYDALDTAIPVYTIKTLFNAIDLFQFTEMYVLNVNSMYKYRNGGCYAALPNIDYVFKDTFGNSLIMMYNLETYDRTAFTIAEIWEDFEEVYYNEA